MEVSVLLTTYNHEKYIAQALDSVLMQETDFDYQIVVLEDCSTDATRDIVKAYHKQYPDRIRLSLAQRNQHSNERFADEFQAAPSPYLAMLDGDDYWTSPKKLQMQANFLQSHPECAICFHNVLRMYQDEDRAPLLYNSAEQKPISEIEDLWQHCFIGGCTPMLRKDAIGTLPDWYNNLPCGDWPLFLLAAERGKIGYIDEVLGVYRIHKGGVWSKLDNTQRLESLIDLYDRMNANFAFRYDKVVQSVQAKWKNELKIARKSNEFVNRYVSPVTIMVVMSRPDEDLPRFGTRELWPFPVRTPRTTRQIFASGARGSAEASWIGKNKYRFQLFQNGKRDRPLASVVVSQNSGTKSESESNKEVIVSGAYITATPNPVPKVDGFGKSIIRWSTGDGSSGRVEVDVEGQPAHYPSDSAAAIEELEQLHRKGAEVLLLPQRAIHLFQRYPELQDYIERNCVLIASEAEVGSIYRFS